MGGGKMDEMGMDGEVEGRDLNEVGPGWQKNDVKNWKKFAPFVSPNGPNWIMSLPLQRPDILPGRYGPGTDGYCPILGE
jgi:hypothetical protein